MLAAVILAAQPGRRCSGSCPSSRRRADGPAGRAPGSAWLEPRTLLIGVMVLALALTEGTANDWLALALQDGYDVARWLAVLGFGGFVAAMTLGRLVGPVLLDRYGRVPVLWAHHGRRRRRACC